MFIPGNALLHASVHTPVNESADDDGPADVVAILVKHCYGIVIDLPTVPGDGAAVGVGALAVLVPVAALFFTLALRVESYGCAITSLSSISVVAARCAHFLT